MAPSCRTGPASMQAPTIRRGYDDAMPSTSDRAPDPRPARTKAAIFAAARALTAGDGEVTVNALAKRAGVSRAAFYSHFSGLDDLMGAMLQQMLDTAWTRGTEFKDQGEHVHQRVRFGYGMLAAHVERHHAFLRGALDWKFSHRTYIGLLDSLVEMHVVAVDRLGDEVPAPLRGEPSTARAIAGAALALAVHWLAETEQQARAEEPLDATGLLETLLRNAPPWYSGFSAEEPVPAAELLEACRAAGEDAAPTA